MTVVRAEKSSLAKFSDSIGMPTDEGFFGFKPFSEMWVGRWAMMGFVSSIVVEAATGRGTLQQLGLYTPSSGLLTAMLVLFGGATAVGSVVTVQSLLTKKMSRKEVERYKVFLGLTKEDDWMADSAARSMKGRPDFATPNIDTAEIEAARSAGMPADRFVAVDAQPGAEAAAREMKAGVATAVQDPPASTSGRAPAAATARAPTMQDLYGVDDLSYAKSVELSNGRAAMMGFLAAILVEAGTGKGIILQIIMYLKWSGILGPMSGF